MDSQNIQAIYLPTSHEPAIGQVALTCLEEGYKLMRLDASDVIFLRLPKATMYMSRSQQRVRSEALENKGASMVVRSAGLSNLSIWGPVLLVNHSSTKIGV